MGRRSADSDASRLPPHADDSESVEAADAEILVLLSGFDESYSQTVHARSSYRWDEVKWNVCFADIFQHDAPDGVLRVDVGRLSEVREP